jgi:hypothetical protein
MTMAAVLQDIKRQTLENRLGTLIAQYTAVSQQANNTLSEGDRILFKAQADAYWREAEVAQAELERLEKGDGDANRYYRDWEANLRRINYHKAIGVVDQVLKGIDDGGAAVFLLKDCKAMEGRWCVRYIREQLEGRTAAGKLKSWPIGFESHQSPDAVALLGHLGRFVGLDSRPADRAQAVQAVIDKITDSLQMGTTILLEVTARNAAALPVPLLTWFLDDFWKHLVDRLPAIGARAPQVVLVAVLVADLGVVQKYPPPELCCKPKQSCGKRIIDLPLERWKEEEIHRWLIKYSRLEIIRPGLKVEQLELIANTIYMGGEQGRPAAAYRSLIEELESHLDKFGEAPDG